MNRPTFIAYRLALDLGNLASRAFNAIFLGGSTAQTTSSRAHLDKRLRALRRIINAAFFWQDDHCALAWADEVQRAKRTLELNEASNA
jgi:precorrin-6B methylase 2